MKNLTKIFMAVVAGMFAFSCVTDTTEDLGVQLGGAHKGQTTLSISMAEVTKTHLGEKTAEGLYPLLWSEGDAIAVNGVVSTPLTAEQADANVASFTLDGELQQPYCVVYPAEASRTEGDVTEGEEVVEPEPANTVYPVNFLTSQPYTVGTFAPQAAPMYGYTTEKSMIQMQHLTGVLRLAVKGNGEKLTALTVTASDGKIAGAFTVDCATGELVALEEAVSTVTVVLPEEGLVLGAEATPIYVTVPAGKHGVYTVTLVSDALTENTMLVKFNSDFHPITAGVVKEFAEFTFTPNADNGEEGELVIVNAAQLKRLAQLSETEQLGNVTKVTIGATIDMSEVAWTPINLFPTHILFDGGADLGYSIKGLSAPLFNMTAATVQNLSLTDVAIVETEDVKVGAIARGFYGTMTKCTASGTLEMNNTTFDTTASLTKFDVINVGGLVGQAGSATFEDCENRVNVTITSAAAEAEAPYIAVGGAIGGAHSGSSFTNVDNYGDLTVDVRETAISLRVGGVIGTMIALSEDVQTAPDVKLVTKCDNRGEIKTTKEATGVTGQFGGITAAMTRGITNFSYNNNYGAITYNDNGASRRAGGIVATHSYSVIDNCTNNAPITNNGAAGATYLGGIIGGDVLAAITNCTNNVEGVIKNSGELIGTNNLYAGGIAACDKVITYTEYADYGYTAEGCHISTCHNHGEVIHDGSCEAIFLAGICARTTSATINDCTNDAAIKQIGISRGNCFISGINGHTCQGIDGCTNSGPVTVGSDTKAPTSGYLYVTGIVGTANSHITESSNSGAITVVGDATSTTSFAVRVAGISCTSYHIEDCSNSGHITVKNFISVPLYVAGISNLAIVTPDTSTEQWANVENSGNITLNNLTGWTGNSNCYIGGLVSHLLPKDKETYTSTNRVELYNWTNKGSITTTNFAPGLASGTTGKEGRTILGGCFGHYTISFFDLNDCDNEGVLNIEIAASSHTFIGGIAGFLNQSLTVADTTCSMQNCDNSGNVTINSIKRSATDTPTAAGEGLILGGAFAEWYVQQGTLQPITLTNCNNSGAVTLKGVNFAPKTSRHVVGGVSADQYSNGTFINCHNNGAVSVEGTVTTAGAKITSNRIIVGGVTAYFHPYKQDNTQIGEWIGCTNTGNISIKNINSASYLMTGGVLGFNEERKTSYAKLQDCGNSGELSMENCSTTSSSFSIGGIIAYSSDTQATFSGEFVNTGNIIAKNVTTDLSKTYIGGILGYTVKPISNAKSYCDIDAQGLEDYAGMIMGIPYATATKATNCGVGGNIISVSEEPSEIPGAAPELTEITTPLNGTNFFEHIYATAVAADVASSDNCVLLNTKPSLPVYTPAE